MHLSVIVTLVIVMALAIKFDFKLRFPSHDIPSIQDPRKNWKMTSRSSRRLKSKMKN